MSAKNKDVFVVEDLELCCPGLILEIEDFITIADGLSPIQYGKFLDLTFDRRARICREILRDRMLSGSWKKDNA